MFTNYVPNIKKTSTLMMIGKSDTVVCNKTARKAMEQLPVADKTLHEFEEPADHYILQDNDYFPEILDRTIKWCDERSA